MWNKHLKSHSNPFVIWTAPMLCNSSVSWQSDVWRQSSNLSKSVYFWFTLKGFLNYLLEEHQHRKIHSPEMKQRGDPYVRAKTGAHVNCPHWTLYRVISPWNVTVVQVKNKNSQQFSVVSGCTWQQTLWWTYSFADALSSCVVMLYLSIVYYWSGSGETCD